MSYRFSLQPGKGKAAQAEQDRKAREDKDVLDKAMADVLEEHGGPKNLPGPSRLSLLGESDDEKEDETGVDSGMFVPTGAKRHFTGRMRSTKSGPGTLDLEPDMGTGFSGASSAYPRAPFGGPAGGAGYQQEVEKENVYAMIVAKASNLPPSISAARIEELFSEYPSLKVTKIETIVPSRPGSPSQDEKPTISMKVVFDKDAQKDEFNKALNKMNDKKYLGQGYYLHLDRYLGRNIGKKERREPFNAKEVQEADDFVNGIAPPTELGGARSSHNWNKRKMVHVAPPADPNTLYMVHQVVEGVLEGGPEFEAALMQESKVQSDEKFAWLFDQRHPVNRYYRWRLHEILSGSSRPEVFEGQPEWRGPKPLKDEFVCSFNDLQVANSVEDPKNESDDENVLSANGRDEDYPGRVQKGYGILSPYDRAFLVFLLLSLPPTAPTCEEIAAFSKFAADHVGKGMEDTIILMVDNIFQPFYLSTANPKFDAEDVSEEAESRRRAQMPHLTTNALKIISDVALTSWKDFAGGWKYRGLIESQLVDREVFKHLESLPQRLQMGRLAENSYRDEINAILKVWQDEGIVENKNMELIDEAFNGKKRKREEEDNARKVEEKRKARKAAAMLKKAEGERVKTAEKEDANVPATTTSSGDAVGSVMETKSQEVPNEDDKLPAKSGAELIADSDEA